MWNLKLQGPWTTDQKITNFEFQRKNHLKRYSNADLKIAYMFLLILKQYPKNFAFVILKILELFTREVCKFLKK